MHTGFLVIVYTLSITKSVHSAVGDVAREKCIEYSDAVYVEEDSPLLLRSAATNRVSQCGIVSVPLIIGGTKTAEKEFPHMTLIGFGSNPREVSWDCGGSLISELFILTAAHCLESKEKGPALKVKLGTIDRNAENDDVQERLVVKRIPHPEYILPAKYNDIALLKMDAPVQFTGFVRPACLNTNNINGENKVIATGFGKQSYEHTTGSSHLMKVQLSIIPTETCSESYTTDALWLPRGIDNSSMICAGEMKGGKDTCQGDSGGPLQTVLKEPYCMYSIIGVTSFGKFCGFAYSPAIYARVSNYVEWIEGIVWA